MRPIIVLDFGGQYAHLIANRVRKLGLYSEIYLPETPLARIKERNPAGIILSGGGGSVYEEDLKADRGLLELGIPVLGICYGFQWLAHVSGGEVRPGAVKEYGRTLIEVVNSGGALLQHDEGKAKRTVWMSHGDEVTKLPEGFVQTARSAACNNVAAENAQRRIFGFQFHPEVVHTEGGMEMLRRFVALCKDASVWSTETFSQRIQEEVKAHVGSRNVFILVSGGVDSTVAYTLLQKVLDPSRVHGLLVDTGFMRYKEVELIQRALQAVGFQQLHVEDASETFFAALKGVYDPERKRAIIGQAFLDVKDRVARDLKLDSDQWLLGQGTIYPDTIETGGTKHAAKIKTHHNRVDAITKLLAEGRVVEPLRDLYKDEVRALGRQLGLPAALVMRHPFPGPGLAVRILCAERADYPAEARRIEAEIAEFLAAGGVKGVACAVLPVRSVGVQGDARSYRHAVALYFLDSPFLAPHPEQLGLLWDLVPAIPNRWAAINRVLACVSHPTPPAKGFAFRNNSQLTRERAALCSAADHQVQTIVQEDGLYEAIWQFPVALLPFGHAEGHEAVVLRPVDSLEAMTATAHHLPSASLKRMRDAVLAVAGIDTLFYDLTSKPPGTIEWE